MKKTKFAFIAMLLATAGMTFVACSKDDDDDNINNSTRNSGVVDSTGVVDSAVVEKTYVGLLTMHLEQMPNVPLPDVADATVKVKLHGNGTATVSLPAISYDLNGREMALPAAQQDNITLVKTDEENYTLQSSQIQQTVDGKSYDGTLQGECKEGKLAMDYTVKYGAMPYALVIHFETGAEPSDNPGDDNPTDSSTVVYGGAADIAGDYDGTLSTYVSMPNAQMTLPDTSYSLTLTATSDTTLTISFTEYAYNTGRSTETLPSLEVPGLKVYKDGEGNYIIEEQRIEQTINVEGTVKNYTCTLSGSERNGTLTLDYSLTYGSMPFPIVFHFVSAE